MTWQLLVEVEPAIGDTLASLSASHVDAPVNVSEGERHGCDGVILHGASPAELKPIVEAYRQAT